jgi:hypothetical protein
MSLTRPDGWGGQVPLDLRMADAETLVILRRKGESIGLSGRWSSDELAANLPQDFRFPIRVTLINHPSAPVPYPALQGSCYRCLVAILPTDSGTSQFSMDLDSVDYEALQEASPREVLLLTHFLLDRVEIESSPHVPSSEAP